ncbi:MAG: PEP-CTERM sorting domain-containing protein [bacterium]|nr:PEP-CTERM sorting domain-containing protein [bacterium]
MRSARLLIFTLTALGFSLGGVKADFNFSDFTQWSPVADPPNGNFSSAASTSMATLSAADAAIPAGVDIGFQSVDGPTVAQSSRGFKFDPQSDFSLAIDYSFSFSNNPVGLLGIGFGIGEDGTGQNSAGVALATLNGSPYLFFGGAARVNDNEQLLPLLPLTAATTQGTLFVSYQASSGNVQVGASGITNANAPQTSGVFAAIQNQWQGEDLLASFFLRSESQNGLPAWQGGGTADAVFSNFRILSGNAIAVPEPSGMLAVGLAMVMAFTRRPRRSYASRTAAATNLL